MTETTRKPCKSRLFRTVAAVAALFLCALAFLSCDMFNKPLQDFLDEWTNVAKIMEHRFDGSYPATGGLTNLPSGGDRVITYYLVNPQNYVLNSTVTFAHEETLVVDNSTLSDFATVEQDATDKSIIRLTLKDSVGATGILPLDGDGTEITPTITIREPNSGRFFGSYTVPVRVNSLPPRLFNAVIMKYRDSNEKYAVCFSLPAMGAGDIHRDITQITVNGTFNGQPFNKTYRVTGGGTETISVEGLETSSISDYEVIGSEFVDMGTTFVGIKTGLDLGPTTPTCTITLTDSSGASTVTTVSTVSTLLNKIYVNGDSGNDNNTGTASSPVKTIGNALEKLRDVPNGTIILQSNISLTGEVTVGSGISVTVTGEGSERTVTNGAGGVFNITSGGSLIVGENITLTGTSGNGGCVIVDGGNFTMDSGSKITGSSASPNGGVGGGVLVLNGTFTMNGGIISGNTATYGGGVSVSGGEFIMRGGTIGGNDPGSANTASYYGSGVYVDGGTFTLSGGTISGNSSSRNGGGVYMDGTFSVSGSPTITGNTVSNNANNVYLPSGKTITIGDGGLTGGSIGVSAEAITPGGAAQITDIDVPGAADRFVSDISPYSIEETIATTDGGTAVFLSDAEVSYQESSALARSLGTFADAVKEANKWTSGGTITLMKNIDGNNAVFGTDGVSIPIIFRGGTCTLDLNGYTINRELSSETDDGQVVVIRSNGNLTIKDSSANADGTGGIGKITGGYDSGNGQNYGDGGGGIYVEGGSLTLESGSITGNKTFKNGGGVYVGSGCTFTMKGGSITGNTANTNGGGVYVDGTFIAGNTPSITGNTVSGNTNNVYLPGGKTITIGTGGLTGGTIGVTVADMKADDAVQITDKNVTGAANRFTSDVAGYTIMEGIAPMEDAVYLFGGNIGTDVNIEVVYSSGGKVQFGTFEEARAASATEITLLKDITPTTAPTVSWPITFNWTCTLDLNGYAIDRKLTTEINNGHVIVIEANGNVTIKDSSATNSDGTNGTGKITGGYPDTSGIIYDSCGGGVAVKGGSFTLESGSITGNKSTGYVYGGGVSINGGEFTMSGGIINGNTAFFGGGVYVKGGNFTMTGGTISGNTAIYDGDGVYVKGGTFNRQGGTVVGDVYQES